jgi:hypothetical protein
MPLMRRSCRASSSFLGLTKVHLFLLLGVRVSGRILSDRDLLFVISSHVLPFASISSLLQHENKKNQFSP